MKQVLILFLILQGQGSIAQDQLNELTVDRPGIAEAPFTVAPRTFQLETGFDYYKRNGWGDFFLPITLFRTRLGKNTEFTISVKNIQDKTSSQKLKGFSPLTAGIKTHIIEQRWDPGNGYFSRSDNSIRWVSGNVQSFCFIRNLIPD
jgi:hypothetical protein